MIFLMAVLYKVSCKLLQDVSRDPTNGQTDWHWRKHNVPGGSNSTDNITEVIKGVVNV